MALDFSKEALDFSQESAPSSGLDFSSGALDFSQEAAPEEKGTFQKVAEFITDADQTGLKEGVPLADMALGFLAVLGDYTTKLSIVGAEGAAEAIEGKDIVPGNALTHARESVEAGMKDPVSAALHAPLRTALDSMGITTPKKAGETTESYVEGAFEKLTTAINNAGDYWKDVTGSEQVGEMVKFGAETAMVGAPLPLKHVPMGKAMSAVGDKVSQVGSKVKNTFIKDAPEVKVKSPEFEKSRIKEEETIPEVLQRKRDREALVAKLDKVQEENLAASAAKEAPKDTPETPKEAPQGVKEGEVIPEQPKEVVEAPKEEVPAVKEESVPSVEETGGIAEQAAEVSKKPPLARTTKDGEVIIDEPAAKADFEAGFPYIFDADTPTGYQKQLVFEHLQLTKDEFKSLIPDAETYNAFLKAHEESHVKNGDHAAYPRTAEGKLDLTNPKAIEIEARATLDAIKAISQARPEELAMQNVYDFILNENREHGTTLQAVTDILSKSSNAILAKDRVATIFSEAMTKLIGKTKLADKMTRAAEAERSYDKLLTDVEKKELLFGGNDRIMPDGSKKVESWVDGKPVFEKNIGLTGVLARMEKKLADGKFESPEARAAYQLRAEKLAHTIKTLVEIGSEEHAIPLLKQINKRLADLGRQAQQVGLINELRQNYIPHVLDWSKFKGTEAQKQSILARMANAPKDSKLVRDFTERRTYEFLRELEKIVEGTGVVVLTDISKVVLAYEKAMQTAIIHKAMFDYLKTNKAPDGKPWVLPDGPEAKAARYVSFEGTGTQAIRDLRVHPDLADAMGFLFRQTDPSIVLRTLGGISHLTKALNVIGSLFHAKSLAEALVLTSPKLFAQQVSGFWNKNAAPRKALDTLRHNAEDPLVNLFIEEGLVIKVEDVQKTIVFDSGKFLDELATKLGPKGKEFHLVQHITNPLDQYVLQNLNTFTWDYMHAAAKLNVATHFFERMKRQNPTFTDAHCAREVSLYVNNTFGGLNWLEVANSVNNKYLRAAALKLGGIQGREWAQIILFAPDWTVSTLRAVLSAAPKEFTSPSKWHPVEGVKGYFNPKTHNDLARRYVVHTALAWLTIIEGINLATSGHHVWENKDPTRVELADGTSIQAAKHSMEAAHWLTNPDKTLGNKLGFWPKALSVSTTATAYPSPTAPKLTDTSALNRLKHIGLLATPFQVSSAIQAPEGEGLKRAISSSLGFPIYGVSDEKMKESRAKGRKEKKKQEVQDEIERIRRGEPKKKEK